MTVWQAGRKRMGKKHKRGNGKYAAGRPMISFRARIVRFVSKLLFKRVSPDSNVVAVRRLFEKVQAGKRIAKNVVVRQATIEGVACEWLIPEGCEDAPILYYLHGGAYLMGSPATHRQMLSFIARESGVRALLPDYALAPENPFPAGLHDCLTVYRGLLAAGANARHIMIGGDSAGGGMTMATLLSLRDAGDDMPLAAILLSPWLDLKASGESMQTRAAKDPWFRPDDMLEIARKYSPDGDLEDPLLSPVYADASGLPETLIQVGDHEILLSDSTRLSDNIAAAGGKVTLQVWPEMWHVFQFFVRQMPESRRAIRDIAKYIRATLAATKTPV
jgi:epsilon-lactone hydrolase